MARRYFTDAELHGVLPGKEREYLAHLYARQERAAAEYRALHGVEIARQVFKFSERLWAADTVAEVGYIAANGLPTGSTRKRIVTTAPDGRVLVTAPSLTAMCFMTCGGGRWDDVIPHEPPGFVERQIAAQAVNGVGERAARRFVMAMHRGGASVDEAYEIMLERFAAPLGAGHELWPTEDVPADRTYRNAWRRSHNGGPIRLDQRKVMEIDEARAWTAYDTMRATGAPLSPEERQPAPDDSRR